MPNATDQSIENDEHTTGWIVKSTNRQALIQNAVSVGLLSFIQKHPMQGSLVSVWHQPKVGTDILGVVGSIPLDELMPKEWGRQAKEWIVHTEPERAVKARDFTAVEIWWCFMGAIIWR